MNNIKYYIGEESVDGINTNSKICAIYRSAANGTRLKGGRICEVVGLEEALSILRFTKDKELLENLSRVIAWYKEINMRWI